MPRLNDAFLLRERAKGATAWINLPVGVSVKLRYIGGIEHFTEKLKRARENETIDELIAKEVVVDWRGLLDDANDPISYTPQICAQIFRDYVGFMDEVISLASDASQFTEVNAIEEELGNSGSS
jgi:hypothetical protein